MAMETKDLIRYGLLGLAAYVAYNHLKDSGVFGGGGGSSAAPSPARQAPQPSQIGPVAVQPAPARPAQPDIAERVKTLGQQQMGSNLASADQWNWFAHEITGKVQPDPEWFGFVGEGRDDLVTFETWYSRYTGANFSLSGLAGLGWGGRLGWGGANVMAEENVWAT